MSETAMKTCAKCGAQAVSAYQPKKAWLCDGCKRRSIGGRFKDPSLKGLAVDHLHLWRKSGKPDRQARPVVRNWLCWCGASKVKVSTGDRVPRPATITVNEPRETRNSERRVS